MNRELIYANRYGDIPLTQEERIELIMKSTNSKKIMILDNLVKENIISSKKNKIKTFSFIWYSVPMPAKRPRVNNVKGYPQIYVPDAKKNLNSFSKFFKSSYPDFKIITTPMTISVRGYAPTPTAFSKLEKVLAELKLIKPWGRTFDTDNFYKAAIDQIIGTVIIDDSLIDEIHGYKYYSIKPRIEYEIKYLEKYPNIIDKIGD